MWRRSRGLYLLRGSDGGESSDGGVHWGLGYEKWEWEGVVGIEDCCTLGRNSKILENCA